MVTKQRRGDVIAAYGWAEQRSKPQPLFGSWFPNKMNEGTVIVPQHLYLKDLTAFLRCSCSIIGLETRIRFLVLYFLLLNAMLLNRLLCIWNVFIYQTRSQEQNSLSKPNTPPRWFILIHTQWWIFYYSLVFVQCVHRPEVYDDVDAGAAGRFHPRIQTGVSVAMLALLWERVHHFPLPWAGENPCYVISSCVKRPRW